MLCSGLLPGSEQCDKYKNKGDITVMKCDELSTLNCTQSERERERERESVCVGIVLFRMF